MKYLILVLLFLTACAQTTVQPTPSTPVTETPDVKSTPTPVVEIGSFKGVPQAALSKAQDYLKANSAKFKNQNYMTLIDFSQNSSKKRMYVLDLKAKTYKTYTVAHGKGSDPNGTGMATKFSNTPDSKMSSLGFYVTEGPYEGQHGLSMYLNGLEASNDKAKQRYIVMHGADYVTASRAGRSWGCPAVEMQYITDLVVKLKNGSLLYIFN